MSKLRVKDNNSEIQYGEGKFNKYFQSEDWNYKNKWSSNKNKK